MAVFPEKPPLPPPPSAPVIGPDGRMTQPWYDFFVRLIRFLAL
mgnify:CR=1 FL=1|jgi:hypothetical protein